MPFEELFPDEAPAPAATRLTSTSIALTTQRIPRAVSAERLSGRSASLPVAAMPPPSSWGRVVTVSLVDSAWSPTHIGPRPTQLAHEKRAFGNLLALLQQPHVVLATLALIFVALLAAHALAPASKSHARATALAPPAEHAGLAVSKAASASPPPTPATTTSQLTVTSVPPGAEVFVLRNSRPERLGPAPLRTQLPPGSYELLASHKGFTAIVRPITVSRQSSAVHLELQPKTAPRALSPAIADAAPLADAAPRPRPAAPAPPGILMVHTKPPCRIFLDGRDSSLTTPQRDIELSAGPHRILLINEEYGIRHQATVRIASGQSIKLIRDFSETLTSPQ